MRRRHAIATVGADFVIGLTAVPLAAALCLGGPAHAGEPMGGLEPNVLPPSPVDARPVPGDYDGDGATDMALKGANGIWYLDLRANNFGGRWDQAYTGYGNATAVPVPADYDNDDVTDMSVNDATGMWGLDYAVGGFGFWNLQLFGYGNAASVPAPADFDGDGKADLSIKADTGDWYINYSADGFGSGWNAHFTGYGNAAAIPVPADYDGDHHADLAVKDAGGCWYIDYWAGGLGGWNEIHCGYGDATAIPVPADYDDDGRADVAVKGNDGTWYVDYAAGGFGAWNAIYSGYGNNSTVAVPGDYDGDGLTDLSVYSTTSGFWYIDFAANGFVGWDTWVDNAGRQIVDFSRPYIVSTTIYGDGGVPAAVLTVGMRYVVDVVVHRGSGSTNAFGVEVNDALSVPQSLNLVNPRGTTYWGDMADGDGNPIVQTHRRFALTPTQAGNFPLGFQLRSAPPYYTGSQVFNPDFGIRVAVASPVQTALSGRVTQRVRNAQGVFVAGPPLEGATVSLVSSGGISTTTDSQGKWHFPIVATPPMAVRITRPGYSELNIVNLTVPISGLFVDAAMEQAFTSLPPGVKYKMYLDYSRGRTLMHVVEITPSEASVRLGRSPFDPAGLCNAGCTGVTQCPAYDTLENIGGALNSLVIMNATWWDVCNGNSEGYTYVNGFLGANVFCGNRGGSTTNCAGSNVFFVEGGTTPLYPDETTPMFTISPYNAFDIVESKSNFREVPSTQWSQVGNPAHPIWDVAPRDGISDVAYAVQIGNPPLLRDGAVVAGADFVNDSYGDYDYAFARTSVGVGPGGKLYLVAADGEGIHGGNGPTGNQLGHFYRDVLGAGRAIGLDSGLSTELLIRTPGGMYRVNTITGEDAGIQLDPYTQVLTTQPGAVGSVAFYLAVSSDVTAASAAPSANGFAVQVQSTIGSSAFQFALTLPKPAHAELKLFDARGRQVAVAFRGELTAGPHRLEWHGSDDRGAALAAGVYYYRLTAGSHQAGGSVVVLQ